MCDNDAVDEYHTEYVVSYGVMIHKYKVYKTQTNTKNYSIIIFTSMHTYRSLFLFFQIGIHCYEYIHICMVARPRIEPQTSRIQGENANHYTNRDRQC